MGRRPSILGILLSVSLLIALLPLGGIAVLRLYESALVRQTETALIAQGAFVAAAYRAALARISPKTLSDPTYGRPAERRWLPDPGKRWHPRPAVEVSNRSLLEQQFHAQEKRIAGLKLRWQRA